jgi:TolB-like protein
LLYLFEDFALDCSRRELRRGSESLSVEPQVFDLLAYLIQNRHRVLSKDDLVEAVWEGRIVSDATLSSRVNAARNALHDSGEEQRLIRTIIRKCFRFVGAVREEGAAGMVLMEPEVGLRLPDRPSIAVLPFVNMSGDKDQDYFADGMVEDIITNLSRIKWLFVIARNSSFVYKDRAVDVKQVGRDLGVRYLLEGSVRKVSNRVRITGQLVEAEDGSHLWADDTTAISMTYSHCRTRLQLTWYPPLSLTFVRPRSNALSASVQKILVPMIFCFVLCPTCTPACLKVPPGGCRCSSRR